jgi:hypothetical protein
MWVLVNFSGKARLCESEVVAVFEAFTAVFAQKHVINKAPAKKPRLTNLGIWSP